MRGVQGVAMGSRSRVCTGLGTGMVPPPWRATNHQSVSFQEDSALMWFSLISDHFCPPLPGRTVDVTLGHPQYKLKTR